MEPSYEEDEERSVPRNPSLSRHNSDVTIPSDTDDLWNKVRQYLADKNPEMNIDKILEKNIMKKDPIVSYGIIEFVITKEAVLYHVFRRRNTAEYSISIRGFASKNQLYEMICLLSADERERILKYQWDDLWDDYYLDHDEGAYLKLKSQASRRFTELKDLVDIANGSHNNGSVKLPITVRPYVFAKGRAHKNESGLDAALREAKEETKVNYDRKNLYFQSPIVQYYTGSDGNRYIDNYYVLQSENHYSCPVQYLSPVKRVTFRGESNMVERLRPVTISHELESDAWLSIPIFTSKKDHWEWQNNVQPYQDYQMFRRHFNALLHLHSHLG